MKEQIIDFSLAALPWIAAGLLLAILCVRGAGKHGKKEQEDNYGAEGMCFGTAIATSLGYNTGIGLSLGMLLGLAVGSSIKKEKHGEGHEKKS